MQKQECLEYVVKTYKEVSHAQACKITGVSRTSKYYIKKMPKKDQKLKSIISKVVGSSRKGREKVIALVQKQHPDISRSKIRRVYKKEGFSLYKRMKAKRIQHAPNPVEVPLKRNEEWALDFMSDSISSGRRFRTLNVIDQYNRQCLGISIKFSIPAVQLTAYLELLIEKHGAPNKIRTDNGPEMTSKAFQLWLESKGIGWSPIQKGKPQQNAIIERFNRTYREDVLDANVFECLQEARQITDEWLQDYNQVRPHQSLNYKSPIEYAAS